MCVRVCVCVYTYILYVLCRLQENGRARVVGEQTYGKGLVQTIARLQDGSAVVVTVATYKTPLGTGPVP